MPTAVPLPFPSTCACSVSPVPDEVGRIFSATLGEFSRPDELIVAVRFFEFTSPLPLRRRRRHSCAIKGRVTGFDPRIENSDNDPFARAVSVPESMTSLQTQEFRRMCGQER
ncbi:hypothetical protein ACMD2_14350 [Ananas comosus]|uniref:Uncharacterized protein n=1 Tax=Ananas comosus TaxID=4615 RepID=A0A199UII6_ANACO|nr:hypothetical protein ACMD2_14350 [Ananas comosus]